MKVMAFPASICSSRSAPLTMKNTTPTMITATYLAIITRYG